MKKFFYIVLTIFLGLLLSFILHALAEVALLQYYFSTGRETRSSYFLGVGWCALPIWTQYSFLVLGIIGGAWLGFYWWDVVYVQKRHWRFKNKK